MASRHIKLVWGASERIRGRWRFGLIGRYERGHGGRGVAVSVRGALCWLAVVAVAGYVAAATALFCWFERKPGNLIRYTDTLLLPARRSAVRELRGRMMVAEGLADLTAQRWSAAAMKLRLGLARDPGNVAGRLALARFYLAANQRPQALELLQAGAARGGVERPLLELLFSTAAEGEDYEVIIRVCDVLLPGAGAERGWLVRQRVQALLGAKRAAEALEAAVAEGAGAAAPVREARVLALLELGRTAEATAFLDAWLADAAAAERVPVVWLQVRAWREAGRLAEMRAAWEKLRQLARDDPRAQVQGLVQLALAGDAAAASAALDEFFLRFSASQPNLMLAANALLEAGQPALVGRCAERAVQEGVPLRSIRLVLLQAQVMAGDWAGARQTRDQLQPLLADAPPVEAFAGAWLERLRQAAAEADDGAQAMLVELLARQPLPLRVFRQTAEVLVTAQRPAGALAVLQVAERNYPGSRSLAALRDRAGAVGTVARVAEPAAAARVTADADGFFAEVRACTAAQRWTDAAELIRATRVAKPGWLGAREPEVLEWQIRVAIHTGDTLELLEAATRLLEGRRESAPRVVMLARELAERGQRATAVRLLNEVLRKYSGFPPALRLRREWQAAADGSAAPPADE